MSAIWLSIMNWIDSSPSEIFGPLEVQTYAWGSTSSLQEVFQFYNFIMKVTLKILNKHTLLGKFSVIVCLCVYEHSGAK